MNTVPLVVAGVEVTAPAHNEQILVEGFIGEFISPGLADPAGSMVVRFPNEQVAASLARRLNTRGRYHAPVLGASLLELPVEICDWPSRRFPDSTIGTWLLPRGRTAATAELTIH